MNIHIFIAIFLASFVLVTFAQDGKVKKNNSTISGQIIGGSAVPLGAFPYMVSIHKLLPVVNYCGGSIIHTNFVLTSAFCVIGGTSFKIFYATTSYNSGSFVTSNSAIYHPQYSATYSHHNIAILKLNSAIPIPVPPVVPTANDPAIVKLMPRSLCCERLVNTNTLTGFGQSAASPMLPSTLFKLSQTEIPNLNCMTPAGLYTADYITPTVFCCSVTLTNTPYTFDEGDPLVRPASSNYPILQVGILSVRKPAVVSPNIIYPVIYTRVCMYHDWLQSVTGINFG